MGKRREKREGWGKRERRRMKKWGGQVDDYIGLNTAVGGGHLVTSLW